MSAAFIRELMRKAVLFAAEEGDEIIVEDRHIDEALKGLVFEGGELTKRLLGASRSVLDSVFVYIRVGLHPCSQPTNEFIFVDTVGHAITPSLQPYL